MRSIAIRLGFLALIGIGALILKPFLSGSASDLAIGDCFDVPTSGQTVKEVQHHPCTDAHGGEVFFVGKHPGASNAVYPTKDALQATIRTMCVPAFNAYTGLDFDTDVTWTFGYFVPTVDGGTSGDRDMTCYAQRVDDGTTNKSIKKS
jgi:Septum formation